MSFSKITHEKKGYWVQRKEIWNNAPGWYPGLLTLNQGLEPKKVWKALHTTRKILWKQVLLFLLSA